MSAFLLSAIPLIGAPAAPAGQPVDQVRITSDWPSFLGPSGAFAGEGEAKLIGKLSQVRQVWRSEEGGIGFGKGHSGAMRSGHLRGSGMPPSGAAGPILAGGLIVQSYYLPRGDVWDQAAEKSLGEGFAEFRSFALVAADDVVIAIDAATGKTRWKTVFEDKGISRGAGKRGEWNVTPCAAGGKVFAFGTTGRIYCLDLASGKLLWESNIGAVHEALERDKQQVLKERRFVKAGGKPYGMLLVADGVLLAPDWAEGLLGIDPATGKLLWHASQRGGITSGYNAPAPVTVSGRPYVACVNRTGDLRLIDHRTGKVLWTHALGSMHLTQPVFGKELLLVMEANRDRTDPKQTDPNQVPPNFGVLAGYRLSEGGAERVWKLDGARYPVECKLDGGPARKIATRRDGIVYHGAWWGQQSKLAIVREADGKVLSSLDDCGHFWCIYLWGDRFFFLTDIQHGHHSTWQVYDLNAEQPSKLDEATFPGHGDHRVCGYEVPMHEIFADGFMFCREVRTDQRWGGIVCYDLRKPK
jgi:hypothetical protein